MGCDGGDRKGRKLNYEGSVVKKFGIFYKIIYYTFSQSVFHILLIFSIYFLILNNFRDNFIFLLGEGGGGSKLCFNRKSLIRDGKFTKVKVSLKITLGNNCILK